MAAGENGSSREVTPGRGGSGGRPNAAALPLSRLAAADGTPREPSNTHRSSSSSSGGPGSGRPLKAVPEAAAAASPSLAGEELGEAPDRPQVVKKHPKNYLCKEVQDSLMRFERECKNNSCAKCDFRRTMLRREENRLAAEEAAADATLLGSNGSRLFRTSSASAAAGEIEKGSLWALGRALVEDKMRRTEADGGALGRDMESLKTTLRLGEGSVLAEHQIKQMTSAFRKIAFEADRSDELRGKIRPSEFQNVLSAAGLNPLPTRRQVKKAFLDFDTDRSGLIDMEEWEQVVRTKPLDYEIRKAFRSVDNDHNGFIDGEELMETFSAFFAVDFTGEEILELTMGRPPDARKLTPDELQDQLHEVKLSYDQFRDTLTEGMFPDEENSVPFLMQKAFTSFDTDRGGTISEEEMRFGLSKLGLELTPAQSKQLFEIIDTDKSGEVDIPEFCKAMMGLDRLGRDIGEECLLLAEDLADRVDAAVREQKGTTLTTTLKAVAD